MDVPNNNGLEKYQRENSKVEKKAGIRVIETMPCTEFWFLIHYKEGYSSHIYMSCQELEQELKKHLPDYKKTEKYFKNKEIYSVLKDNNKQEKAIKDSKPYCEGKIQSGNPLFPFSEIGGLVEILLSKKY